MCTPSNAPAELDSVKTTADILRERRLELGLSRAELARYVSSACQPTDIEVLESQRLLMPSWIRLRQLAEALEVPVSDLLPSSCRDDSGSQSSPNQSSS